MFAFRDAFRAGDSRKKLDRRVDGERVISARGSLRRRGVDEAVLKQDLAVDLVSLVNTIDLASVVPLDPGSHIARSVLNFGLPDITGHVSEEGSIPDIGRLLRAALLNNEPRLHAETLRVEQDKAFDDVNQRVRFTVAAEMDSRPVDIPIEFIAEVDVGSGKVTFARLPAPA